MDRIVDCQASLKKSNIAIEIPGFTAKEAGEAFCTVCRYDKSYDGTVSKELVSKVLSSSWPQVSKSVLGGIQHIVSVDNAAGYAELWHKGGSWYTLTGAELKKSGDWDSFSMVSGITKGMSLSEAVPRFIEAFYGGAIVKSDKPCPCGK